MNQMPQFISFSNFYVSYVNYLNYISLFSQANQRFSAELRAQCSLFFRQTQGHFTKPKGFFSQTNG